MKIKPSGLMFWIFQFTMWSLSLFFLLADGFSLFDAFIVEVFLVGFLLIKLFELEKNIAIKKVKIDNANGLLEYKKKWER